MYALWCFYGFVGVCQSFVDALFCIIVSSSIHYCRNMVPVVPIGTSGETSLSCRWCQKGQYLGVYWFVVSELSLLNFNPTQTNGLLTYNKCTDNPKKKFTKRYAYYGFSINTYASMTVQWHVLNAMFLPIDWCIIKFNISKTTCLLLCIVLINALVRQCADM